MSSDNNSITSQQDLTAAEPAIQRTYEFEDFYLDAAHRMLYRRGKTVALKPKVVETLVALVDRNGEVVSKEELIRQLWGDSFVEESNLTQNIYLLRKVLGNCTDGQPFIENFARRGYRFNGKVDLKSDVELILATHTQTRTIVEDDVQQAPAPWKWPMLGLAFVAVLGGITLGVKQFIPYPDSPQVAALAATPFQNFSLKRYSDNHGITGGVVSHDGKFIAYTGKQNAILLKNTATEDTIEILAAAEVTRSVISFSPDDNHIYFFNIAADKNAKVARMSVVGGAVEQIAIEDAWSGASLSPDGNHLAFIREDNETGKQALIIANTDGTGERQTAISEEGKWFGLWSQSTAWSPDGSRIAVTGGTHLDRTSAWDIKLFRVADGEELSTIRSEAAWRWIDAVLWLPDGDNLLAISGDDTSQGQIYKHTISTGEWRRVTNDLSNYVLLSATNDGKTVVTVQHENPGNLWLLPATGDTREAKQITSGRNLMTDATGVSWTPGGKIVFATNAGGRWEIQIVDKDGPDQRQLTHNCAGNDSCGQPVVSPDGRYVVFHATRGGVTNIWRIDMDGGNPTQLTVDGGFNPAITVDSRAVIFIHFSPSQMLWQVPIERGKAEQFSKIGSIGPVGFSPDGTRMAFGYHDKTAQQPFQTCVARVSASSPEKCFGISRSFPRWAPDGKAFYYLDHDYLGIWKQPIDGERTMFLEFPGERTTNFAFSPDGKDLVVARSKPTQDIVALTDEN